MDTAPAFPDASIPHESGRPKAVAWLWAAMALSVLGPALLFCYVAVSTRSAAVQDAQQRLVRVGQIAQEHARRVAETNDVIARAIQLAVASRPNEALMADRASLHQLLRTLATELPQVQSIWLWDAQGHPVVSSVALNPPPTLDVSDRAYFRWARENRGAEWFVSEPLTSRTTGELFFDFSRRREDAAGAFVGVLSVSLLPSYFNAFFEEQVLHDPGFAVALIRSDGTVLARYPVTPVGTRLGQGSKLLASMQAGVDRGDVQGVSTIDYRARHLSFRRVGSLPVYAVATGDEEMVLAPWRRSMVLLAAFTFPLSAALLVLCGFALRRVKLQHALANAHAQEYQLRLKTEDALRHAQKLEALGHLTAGVAHDFNNLLMVVNMNATILEKKSGGQRPQPLVAIQNAVQTGAKLTRQLVSFARRQPLLPQVVEFSERLPADIELLRTVVGSRVRLDAGVEPGTPPVKVDANELELAFINLAVNAKDAMDDGGQLLVRIGTRKGPLGTQVQVAFSDTGRGIAPDHLAKVFEPFFTTKAPGSGTGLGLSQVKNFCLRAGGDAEIESVPGRGTTVRMLFPALEAAAERAPQGGEPPVAASLDAHLLLVEDNGEVALATRALLEAMGARVSVCENAHEALGLLERASFDVVLTDVKMPGTIDGIELAGRLRASHPRLPVLVMTGYADRLDAAEVMGLKVLPKPIDAKLLQRELAACLGTSFAASGSLS